MIKKILEKALSEGLSFHVSYEGETDYCGSNIDHALTALNACDEMELRLLDSGEVIAWALYIPGLDEDECIADCSRLIDEWIDEMR